VLRNPWRLEACSSRSTISHSRAGVMCERCLCCTQLQLDGDAAVPSVRVVMPNTLRAVYHVMSGHGGERCSALCATSLGRPSSDTGTLPSGLPMVRGKVVEWAQIRA
jgi:hypothetical protein